MKKLLIAVVAVGSCTMAQAVTYTWRGANGAEWTEAANWVVTEGTAPDTEAWPKGGDKAIFDSEATGNPTVPPRIAEDTVLEIYRGRNVEVTWCWDVLGTLKLTGPGYFSNSHGGGSARPMPAAARTSSRRRPACRSRARGAVTARSPTTAPPRRPALSCS